MKAHAVAIPEIVYGGRFDEQVGWARGRGGRAGDGHGDRVHRRTVDEAIPEAEKTLGIDIFNAHDGEGNGKPRPNFNAYTIEKPFQPDYHAGATETAIVAAYFPGEANLELAKTLKPEGTWQPLGYVGDPANYDKVDVKAFQAMVDYLDDNIIAWLNNKAKGKADAPGAK